MHLKLSEVFIPPFTDMLPSYGSTYSMCFDIMSSEDVELPVGVPTVVPTGLYLKNDTLISALGQDKSAALFILSRSGLATKGVQVYNAPGVVDIDYKGEIRVILYSANENFLIKRGSRVAQGYFYNINIERDLDALPERVGGFGSTGS